MFGPQSPVRIVKFVVGRGWHVALAAGVLAVLLLPSAPPERTAEAAVQQPFQCRPAAIWDIFSSHTFLSFRNGTITQVAVTASDDIAPRNDPRYVTGPRLSGLSVPSSAGVLDNDDYDPEPTFAPLVRLVRPPSHAQDFTLNDNGSYSYAPADRYSGPDSFQYSFRDPDGFCWGNIATVTLPSVDRRIYDDQFETTANTALDLTAPWACLTVVPGSTLPSDNWCGLRSNDLNPEPIFGVFWSNGANGGALNGVTSATMFVPGGTLFIRRDGGFRFTPDPGFVGTTEFFYDSNDLSGPTVLGSHTISNPPFITVPPPPVSVAKVTIQVVPPPDLSVFDPLGIDDTYAINEDGQLRVRMDSPVVNPDTTALTYNDFNAKFSTLIGGASHGSVVVDPCTFSEAQLPGGCTPLDRTAVVYTPDPNYNGLDSFEYQVVSTNFANTVTSRATVNLIINPVRDQPVLQPDTFNAKRGEQAVLDVLANDIDPDDLIDPTTVGLEFQPDSVAGDLRLGADGTFLYTPDGSESPKAFSYRAGTTDGQAILASSFTVNVDPNPAADDSYVTNEDTPLTMSAPGVLANDVLGTGTVVPTTGIQTSQFGFAMLRPDGSFTYTPPANFSGTDTFVYGHNNDAALVTITVHSLADTPLLTLNIAECTGICIDRPDPDDRVELGAGDFARLRGMILDPERDSGTIEIDWGDGEKTTRGYPCGFAEILCPYSVAQNQSWFPAGLGNCGAGPCSNAIFFDFSHAYDGAPPPDGIRYDITVKVTSVGEDLTGQAATYATLADADGDGDADQFDNCPSAANGDQADFDGDGLGDACDVDDDGDGVIDTADNCQLEPNVDQANNDGDAPGDACDRDDDNDGIPDDFAIGFDNCQFVANPDQLDTDRDGEGDACDPDDDDDGVVDTADNCRLVANAGQVNNDGDAQGDACDADDDNDTVADAADNCQFAANALQANFDGDAQGDACDANDDNDLLPDSADACDLEVPQGGLDADANGCTDTIARLRDVVTNLSIAKGTKNTLLGTLSSAQKSYDSRKIPQAEAKLRDFIAQVQALRGRGLTNAQADLLIAYANNIIVLI